MESVQQAGDRIHQALSSSAKNKNEVTLEIIVNQNFNNRLAIAQYYKAAYGVSLYDEIKKKIGGDYGNAAGLMFLSPLEFCIKMLIKGLKNSDESCIFEMLTSKTQEELKLIQEAYRVEANKDLLADLDKAFSGSLKKNVFNIFQVERINNPNPNRPECEKYATNLIEVTEKNWTEDENIFREIFLRRSPEELIVIARYYLKKTGKNLLDVIDKKVGGKNKVLLREVLYNNIMPHELFAEKVNSSIKGLGTDEEKLTRVLVSRCELDMLAIREMYQYKYKVSMREDIIGDTSDFYQKICVYLSEK